ncbi:MAG: hypothetical protein WCJ61_00955 [Paludibacter sp.]
MWQFLLSKWIIILIFGLGGGSIGLIVSLLTKPKYTANLSFALVEKSSGGGGLADLASSFGFGGLMGGTSGAFSGDNLLEIIQSRYAIEQTLLTPIIYKGKKENLVEAFIQFNELRKEWSKVKNKPELKNLTYPIGQNRNTFTRTQDSVLFEIYSDIIDTKALLVVRKNKKISIVKVSFESKDESFSKLFVETLMDETYQFYSETRTSQSRANINMMEHTADSIKNLYESALYKSAGYSPVNINPALQFAAVPKIKQENNAQLYATVYAEVLKNLETLKLDLARETPLVQIIDTPRMPLKKEKLGKGKGIVFGGLFGGLLIITLLIGNNYFNEQIKEVQ